MRFSEMVRLNVFLTGAEGRELWFSRGIEEILHRYNIFLKGKQYEIFVRWVCLNVCLTGVDGRELWFSRGIEEILHIYEIVLKGQQHDIFVRWVVEGRGGSSGSAEASRRPYIDYK
jgi:hypothetical protein